MHWLNLTKNSAHCLAFFSCISAMATVSVSRQKRKRYEDMPSERLRMSVSWAERSRMDWLNLRYKQVCKELEEAQNMVKELEKEMRVV